MAARTELTDEGDDEEFEDANETMQIPSDQDLAACIEQSGIALKLFLNNKFTQARELMQPCSDWSMYHSLGYGTIMYLQAVMTFDMNDIELAIQTIKKALVVCNKCRKKMTVISAIARVASKTSYNDLTDAEIHAELCYAECQLLRALLTFIQDENLISFVKGGLKIRECYKVYKECNKILNQRRFEEAAQKMHFESGVRMGIGAFNLGDEGTVNQNKMESVMISLLPNKVLKLLEFVGFSGNKKVGLGELKKGSDMPLSLRGPLCSIIIIAYHTVVCYVLGLADGDIEFASEVLEPCLRQYPKGALFLFFAGRIEEVRGNIEEATYKFEESIESQTEWRQFHHLCYWELMWCHCFKNDWLLAMKYAEKLCKESRWSKATYMYQKASFLMMCDDQTEDTHSHLTYLISEVPKLKQRIAGKSIPIEKFAVHKAKRYMEENQQLVLPAFELIYMWNGFNILGKNTQLLEPFLVEVERTINNIIQNKASHPCYYDDYCLALLLKGVCLKHRAQYFQAEQCFTEVVSNEKYIKKDTFLIPYATVELAILSLMQENMQDVHTYIERTKKNYKGYLLESRLHFRIHAIKLQMSNMNSSSSSGGGADLESPVESPKYGHAAHWGNDSTDTGSENNGEYCERL